MVHSEVYEGLLPRPPSASPQARDEDRGWGSSLKTCALCVLVLFNLAFWYSSAPQQVALAPPAPAAAESSWLSAAVQAAETAAMRSCSGHGDVFIDTVLVGSDGAQICECHECFTGPDCAVPIPDCAADADSGDPQLFEDYWRQHPEMGTVVTPGWYRMGYQIRDGQIIMNFLNNALEAAIRELHALTGNAVTEGRYIVLGTGSIQLINAAVHSLALQQLNVSNVVALAPYYGAYEWQTKTFSTANYRWAGEPERSSSTSLNGGPVIELIASPNNPTATIQEVPSNTSGVVVYDHAYYWPHLTAITKAVDNDIMLFTLSKITGHAGTRIGWAIVKDLDLSVKMMNYVFLNTLGVSHDSQLRATQLLHSVVKSYTRPTMSPEKGIFHYGHEVLLGRWARLEAIFSKSSRFSLQHIETQHCSFFGKKSAPSPGYAWVYCERDEDMDCSEVMLRANITGRAGMLFGSSNRYVRLTLLRRQTNFENLAAHLSVLVSQG